MSGIPKDWSGRTPKEASRTETAREAQDESIPTYSVSMLSIALDYCSD